MSSRYVQHPMEKNYADYEKEKMRKRVAEIMRSKEANSISDCGCRFESDNSSSVILCANCSESQR